MTIFPFLQDNWFCFDINEIIKQINNELNLTWVKNNHTKEYCENQKIHADKTLGIPCVWAVDWAVTLFVVMPLFTSGAVTGVGNSAALPGP